MRIMAIDYGDARTGVAISDPTGLLAGYTTVIQSRKEGVVAEELARLAKEHSVDELVMGFPRNMDGTEGPRAELYRAFAARLEEVCGCLLYTSQRAHQERRGPDHPRGDHRLRRPLLYLHHQDSPRRRSHQEGVQHRVRLRCAQQDQGGHHQQGGCPQDRRCLLYTSRCV